MFEQKQTSHYIKNREKINWKIPSLFNKDDAALIFFDVFKELGLKSPFQATYGNICCPWNAGRFTEIKEIDYKEAEKIVNQYNSREISCCLTFNAYNITKDDLSDVSGNMQLKIINEGSYQNYAIVSSDLLAEYIRDNYPNVKLIASVIKHYYDVEGYNEPPEYYDNLCKTYDKVVIRPDFCFDLKALKKIKNKTKMEIMPNLGCIKKCSLKAKHYDIVNKIERGLLDRSAVNFCNKKVDDIKFVYDTTLINNEQIDKIINMGFTDFKLNGRSYSLDIFFEMFGIYIFDASGIFRNIRIVTFSRMEKKGLL